MTVPPVPTPATKMSTFPSVSSQISGPVVSLWAFALAGLSNCPGIKAPGISFANSSAFADDRHSGSVPFSFETVFDKAGDADVWIIKYNRETDLTYSALAAEYAPYTGFKAYRDRNIYGCNTSKVAYYEETPFHPDYLLSDYIQILHPEIHLPEGLRYFSKLCE